MEEWEDEVAPQIVLSENAQLCTSAVALAAAIDVCRDREARKQLQLALRSIVWRLNPPRGEIHEFSKKTN